MASLSRKISSSTNLLIFVLIIAGFLALINFLATRHFGRLDFTKNKLYTLSDSSINIVSSLDDIVKVTCYFSKNLPADVIPMKLQVSDILDEYRAYAKGNIQIEFLDPTDDPVLTQKLRFMGIPQVQLNIMEKDQASATNVYMGVAVSYEDKQEVIPFVTNVNNLEYDITSSILKVTRKEKKTVGFLIGHEEHSIYRDCQAVHKALTRQYEVEEVSLSPGQPIPEHINIVIVSGPARVSDQDKYAIDQYIMKGGKVVFLLDILTIQAEGALQASYRETNLNDLLENYGVRVTKNLVLDKFNMIVPFQTGYTQVQLPYPFFVKVVKEENGFNSDNAIVNQLGSMVFPWISALEPLKENNPEAQFTVLAQSSQYSWLQKGMYDLSPQEFTPPPDDIKAYPLALLVSGKFKSFFADKEVPLVKQSAEEEEGPVQNQETIKQSEQGSQILVVANGRFINDAYLEPGNMEFFLNAVDWFTWGKDLIGVRSRMVLEQTLPVLSERQKTAIKFANLAGVPILLAFFGIIRFYIRKKKKITLETLK